MSLQVDMDKWDYQEAIKAVQKLLDDIEVQHDNESDPIKLLNVPRAEDIVDLVWDKIK